VRTRLKERQAEHGVRRHDTANRTHGLGHRVSNSLFPAQRALECCGERHRGVEMRAGNRAEDRDEHKQAGTRRQGVREQGNGGVTRRQLLAHDARSDHDGEQERGAERLRHDPSNHCALPICFRRCSNAI
jgi:hypothetical protein